MKIMGFNGLILKEKAISEVLGALRQLSRAVSLQTLRILDAGKTGFPERLKSS